MLSFKEYLVERSDDKRFWFNSRTKKLVPVTAEYHDWEPVKNPEKFGLKRSQVLEFEADVEDNQDRIDGIKKLMRAGKWVRIIIQFFSSKPSWSIDAETLPQVSAAIKTLLKKHQSPGVLVLDHGPKSILLQDGQVDDFIKTGKLVKRTEIGSTMARFR